MSPTPSPDPTAAPFRSPVPPRPTPGPGRRRGSSRRPGGHLRLVEGYLAQLREEAGWRAAAAVRADTRPGGGTRL